MKNYYYAFNYAKSQYCEKNMVTVYIGTKAEFIKKYGGLEWLELKILDAKGIQYLKTMYLKVANILTEQVSEY